MICVYIEKKKMGKIPMEEIKKELELIELSKDAIEDLLQVLTIKSLTELEGIVIKYLFITIKNKKK